MSDLFIGAYWGPREESTAQCASRLDMCLTSLALGSKLFRFWYKRGKSKPEALIHPIDSERLTSLVASGKRTRDSDNSNIECLGYRIGIWNGENEDLSASLSITCGMHARTPHLSNAVVLNLPSELGDSTYREVSLQALTSIISSWEPDWAAVISHQSADSRPFTTGKPFVDWMLYLRGSTFDHCKLPISASCIELENLGKVVITQDCPIEPKNPTHIQNVEAVESIVYKTSST